MFLDQLFSFVADLMRTILGALLLPMMVLSLLAVLMGASPGAIGAALGEAMECFVGFLIEVLLRLPGLLFSLLGFLLALLRRLLAAISGEKP